MGLGTGLVGAMAGPRDTEFGWVSPTPLTFVLVGTQSSGVALRSADSGHSGHAGRSMVQSAVIRGSLRRVRSAVKRTMATVTTRASKRNGDAWRVQSLSVYRRRYNGKIPAQFRRHGVDFTTMCEDPGHVVT